MIPREQYKAKRELDEARKAGTLPPEQDAEGNLINPHIPAFMANAPWYLGESQPGLAHQRKAEAEKTSFGFSSYYKRGEFAGQASTYRKGACKNCGALTHTEKDCTDRPRKLGAWKTGRDIKPDEYVYSSSSSKVSAVAPGGVVVDVAPMDFDSKRDRYNGYDPEEHAQTIAKFQAAEEARKKLAAEEKARKEAAALAEKQAREQEAARLREEKLSRRADRARRREEQQARRKSRAQAATEDSLSTAHAPGFSGGEEGRPRPEPREAALPLPLKDDDASTASGASGSTGSGGNKRPRRHDRVDLSAPFDAGRATTNENASNGGQKVGGDDDDDDASSTVSSDTSSSSSSGRSHGSSSTASSFSASDDDSEAEKRKRRRRRAGSKSGDEGESGADSDDYDDVREKDTAQILKDDLAGGAGGGGRAGVGGAQGNMKAKMGQRNLRVREDRAKYLLNLDVNSAYYDPKTRSMREDPFAGQAGHISTDAASAGASGAAAYRGDLAWRQSGEYQDLMKAQLFAWEASEKGGAEVHLQANPTQLEYLRKQYALKKEQLAHDKQQAVLAKYGGEEHLKAPVPKELLAPAAASEGYVEYRPEDGRAVPAGSAEAAQAAQAAAGSAGGSASSSSSGGRAVSKYREDDYPGNHKSVWGSYWDKEEKCWGYACCSSIVFNSYCTGKAGREAAQAAAAFRQQAPAEPTVPASWSSSSSSAPTSGVGQKRQRDEQAAEERESRSYGEDADAYGDDGMEASGRSGAGGRPRGQKLPRGGQ